MKLYCLNKRGEACWGVTKGHLVEDFHCRATNCGRYIVFFFSGKVEVLKIYSDNFVTILFSKINRSQSKYVGIIKEPNYEEN